MAHTESFRHRIVNRIETDTHDLGFLYTTSCVAAYKLTGDERAGDTALMAAAIAACGMMEMAEHLPEKKAGLYMTAANRLMKALYETCAAKGPKESDGQLSESNQTAAFSLSGRR